MEQVLLNNELVLYSVGKLCSLEHVSVYRVPPGGIPQVCVCVWSDLPGAVYIVPALGS